MSWTRPELWVVAYAACGALAIWGKDPQRRLLHWVFKPLATLLLVPALLVLAPESTARWWFVGGICLSAIGDALLMAHKKWFPIGLAAFLLGLSAYAVAFSFEVPVATRQLVYVVLPTAFAMLVVRRLWPHLEGLKIPVLLYVGGLVALFWRALSRFDSPDVTLAAWLVGSAGAALFIAGDALLGFRRFAGTRVPYPLELGTYYAAQLCLSLSMWI